MGVMAIVTHQCAAIALWMEKFMRRETVVDEQQCAANQTLCQTRDQRRCRQADFGFVVVGQVICADRLPQGGGRGVVVPCKVIVVRDNTDFLNAVLMPAYSVDGQSIQHFVADDDRVQLIRQLFQP